MPHLGSESIEAGGGGMEVVVDMNDDKRPERRD
jgi:hypothetical protein